MSTKNSAAPIELRDISKTFHDRDRGEVRAVRPLHLDMPAGELTTLLGPSGCGKTTLLRMVAGFEEPTTGQIIISGEDQTNVMANRRDIGFVFQNYALFPHMTVFDNVAYGLKLKGMSAARMKPAVQEVLDMVGLSGMERRFPNQLSGGEQQRVALARVIVTRPRVLLFDEPLSNLDAKRRVQMREEIRQLQKTLSITSLYVTHDQEEALAISDRIVVMNKGQIEQIGTPQEIYSAPRSVFVANFVGKSNVLPATVRTVSDDVIQLEATVDGDTNGNGSGRTHPLRLPGDVAVDGEIEASGDTRLRAGDDVYALIRPEAVEVHADAEDPASDPAPNVLHGRIASVIYLGEKVEYDVDAEGHDLKVVVSDPQKTAVFEPGARVSVRLPKERISVVTR